MTTASGFAAVRSAAPSLATSSAAVAQAAQLLLPDLEGGRRIDAGILRTAMGAAFGASDAAGAWDWKTAYDACEAATVLVPAQMRQGASPYIRFSDRRAADAGEGREPASDRPIRAAPWRARRSSNEFIQSQMQAMTEQVKDLSETATKTVMDAVINKSISKCTVRWHI